MATPSPIRSVSSAGFFFSRHLRLPGALRELAYSVVRFPVKVGAPENGSVPLSAVLPATGRC